MDNKLLTIKASEDVVNFTTFKCEKKNSIKHYLLLTKFALHINIMKHFINLKDISIKDLRKILKDAKKEKKRSKLNTLQTDKDIPLKGKMLIQMFEKSSLRTRLSFYLAIKQLGGGTITLRSNELHLGEGGRVIGRYSKNTLNLWRWFCFKN